MEYKQIAKLIAVTENEMPNQETLDAMAETLSGECMVFDNVEDFFEHVNI